MGAGGAGASGSDAGFENTQKSKLTKTNQEIVDSNFRDRGANKIKKGIKTPSIAINVLGTVLSKPLQAGSRVNRDFFTDKVLGSKNFKGTSKSNFMSMSVSQQESIYGDYMSSRQAGKTDAYGNSIGNNNNESSMIKKNIGGKIVSVAPTAAEVSQSEAANATSEEDSILLRKKKTKAKGRSATILTSSKGVDETLTLGRKSLLGQ